MTEAQLSKKIAEALRKRGAWAVKTHGDPRQRRGLPDILVCYRGYFLGIEVKLPGKEDNVTKLQQDTLDSIRAAGGETVIASHVRHATQWLDEFDQWDAVAEERK